jgi:anti-sigma factor RsiW
MNCETARQELVLSMYGELTFEEEDRLEGHLAGCAECAAERARLEKMDALIAAPEAGPPASLLSRCRRDLAARLERERASARRFPRPGFWRGWLAGPPLWWRPLGALALLAIGFFGARLMPGPGPGSGPPAQALRSDSPSAVARVRLVNAEPAGRVRVLYDEVLAREIAGDPNDERIRRLLLAAAADPVDPGVRVDSLELLKSQAADEEVRHALLDALRGDPNSGVRLKALEGLRSYARDPETRKVLAHVLLTDDNASVRTQAIDLLVESQAPDVAGVLQELVRRERNSYIGARSQTALSEMKASAGTF